MQFDKATFIARCSKPFQDLLECKIIRDIFEKISIHDAIKIQFNE